MMNKVMWINWLLASVVLAVPTANVKVEVVDESGSPMQDALVTISFGINDVWHDLEGLTDTNGQFSAKEETYPRVGIGAKKDGYYRSVRTVFLELVGQPQDHYSSRQKTYEIMLRKKKEVKEMLHKRIQQLPIPVYEQPVGFDVKQGDWVTPYGKGKVSDFLFTVARANGMATFYTLSFSNEGDGAQEYQLLNTASLFKWPHQAPLKGYLRFIQKEIRYSREVAVSPGLAVKKDSDVNYIFRVRTKFDENGDIVSALYGKVRGEIKIRSKGHLHFQYWLNEDMFSQSLESTHKLFP